LDLLFSLHHNDINSANFNFEGTKTSGEKIKRKLDSAFMYLNAPYLWGGKTPFGIDCSGFTNGLQTQWIC
jgi:cell wall-associated NlpC family hydrolase